MHTKFLLPKNTYTSPPTSKNNIFNILHSQYLKKVEASISMIKKRSYEKDGHVPNTFNCYTHPFKT